MRWLEERSVPEIAVALDLPEGCVWARLHRVRRRLSDFLRRGGFGAS